MEIQRIIRMLPAPLRRHKLIRALRTLDPASRLQRIQFNGDAEVVIDLDDGDARTILINGEFDREYFRIARPFLEAGGTCFDVGANFGLCSFGLARACPRVQYHLFEANPQLWPTLRRSMALHPGVDIRLVEAAVGERHGSAALHNDYAGDDTGKAFIREGGEMATRMITLDEHIEASGTSHVEFMKMDIEGYEIFAIDGARRSIAAGKLPVVYFELKQPLSARFGKTAADVLDRFRSLDFRLYHVRDQDFTVVNAARDVNIRGLRVAPVSEYPETLWTDLLAIHRSSGLVPAH